VVLVLVIFLLGCAPRSAPTACPPLEIESAPATAEALEQRISAVAGAGGLLSFTIAEDDATAYLRHRLLMDDAIESRITLRSQNICAQLSLPCLGQQLPVVAELAPHVADDHLVVDLVSLSLLGRSVPAWLRRSAESTLNELLVELSGDALVQSASIEDHALTLVIQFARAH
jgi:hypothetical protein